MNSDAGEPGATSHIPPSQIETREGAAGLLFMYLLTFLLFAAWFPLLFNKSSSVKRQTPALNDSPEFSLVLPATKKSSRGNLMRRRWWPDVSTFGLTDVLCRTLCQMSEANSTDDLHKFGRSKIDCYWLAAPWGPYASSIFFLPPVSQVFCFFGFFFFMLDRKWQKTYSSTSIKQSER